ncbi:MAG: hypothetical protein ACTSQL_01120 [Promethearchaeota archaeon]
MLTKLFLIFLLGIFGITLGIFAMEDTAINETSNETNTTILKNISVAESEKEIIERCFNLSLNETGKCLNKEIKRFYNYTSVRGDVAIGFERIKNYGGD